jgi:ATP adenylyltransferase
MMLVPRTQECFQSISINALGFAGALLVTDIGGVGVLREHGPMSALAAVA